MQTLIRLPLFAAAGRVDFGAPPRPSFRYSRKTRMDATESGG
jgi:hypothetical protein